MSGNFPIDFKDYKPLALDTSQEELTKEQETQLKTNIGIIRDSIVFMTANSNAKGIGGHTGGAYDIVPEFLMIDGIIRSSSENIHPVFYDGAGHRVAIQYIMAALDPKKPMTLDDLLYYREYGKGLPGHPERDENVDFSGGRLGHLESYIVGIAEREKEKTIVVFSSDGSLQEGDSVEAARYSLAKNLNVLWIVDDNNVTIEGKTKEYMPGFDVKNTLQGQGLYVLEGEGENLKDLFFRIQVGLMNQGPSIIVNKRKMAPGIPNIEGTPKAHDAIDLETAILYLDQKGQTNAINFLRKVEKQKTSIEYLGSSKEKSSTRKEFGNIVQEIIDSKPLGEKNKLLVISNDLGGSCGINIIGNKHPEIYRIAGPMERNNFSVAAGFGSEKGYQGIYGTFSAFLEMIISEITMARLNKSNVLAHFSHAGIDDMADNTSHFGTNIFFADNGFIDDNTRMYFPADAHQLKAIVNEIFYDEGLRFVFSTRSKVPDILHEDGNRFFDYKKGYFFEKGKDEIIRGPLRHKPPEGFVISYGPDLHVALDAVERARNNGIKVGLINKPTLNVVDEEMLGLIGRSKFVLSVESQNYKTGLGSKLGTWLLEKGHSPLFERMGVTLPGQGGLNEQRAHQNLASKDIEIKIRELNNKV